MAEKDDDDFDVFFDGQYQGTVHWDLTGEHNRLNALLPSQQRDTLGYGLNNHRFAFPIQKRQKAYGMSWKRRRYYRL